jgi:hypothetical protein
MINKENLKRFFEETTASRREFLDYIGKMSLIAMAGSLNLSLSEESQAENVNFGGELFDITELMNSECLFCYPIGMCVELLSHGKVCVAFRIKYKIPIGFAETGDAGQFGMSSKKLSFLSYNYSYLNNDLNLGNGGKPIIPPGTRYGYEGQGQAKMQLYPHYYGLSPWMIPQVQKRMSLVNKLNKACTPCLHMVLAEVAAVNRHQVALPGEVSAAAQTYLEQLMDEAENGKFVKKFYGNKQIASEMYHKVKYINEHFYQLARDLSSAYASTQIPSVPSELFAFMWTIPELSPDREKWEDIMLALKKYMKKGLVQSYELACPNMYRFIAQYPEVAQAFADSGLDPSFVCVGLWGNGYPRVGDIEAADPIVGGLLSIARWHHLISTTIQTYTRDGYKRPLVETPPQASWYQMYHPSIFPVGSRCFQPGWMFTDLFNNIVNMLICPEIPDIISAMSHPSNSYYASVIQTEYNVPLSALAFYTANAIGSALCLGSAIAGGGFSLSGTLKYMNPLSKRTRNVGVIVYQEHERCCCPY